MFFNNQAIRDFVKSYPRMNYHKESDKISGVVKVNHIFNDERIIDEYNVVIQLNSYDQNKLPDVYERDGMIPRRFNHQFIDGSLCLATIGDQKLFFREGKALTDWYEAYVIPYFYSVSYFLEYNTYPFGDRKHGYLGILEFYKEKFDVSNLREAYLLLDFIVNGVYRGHLKCPCGSEKRLRNCHKDIVQHYMNNEYIDILTEELMLIDYDRSRQYE